MELRKLLKLLLRYWPVTATYALIGAALFFSIDIVTFLLGVLSWACFLVLMGSFIDSKINGWPIFPFMIVLSVGFTAILANYSDVRLSIAALSLAYLTTLHYVRYVNERRAKNKSEDHIPRR